VIYLKCKYCHTRVLTAEAANQHRRTAASLQVPHNEFEVIDSND
jgi:hypothetical protein